MKKRDIFLDFTSLLDVTLILIFFFVIFSHLDGQKQEKEYESKMAEYESVIDNYDGEKENNIAIKESELNNKESELDAKESELNEESEALEKGKSEFGEGNNIKIILNMDSNPWYVTIKKGEEVVDSIKEYQWTDNYLLDIMEKMKYDKDDVIFCQFIYNADIDGTNRACKKIIETIDEIKKNYSNIYVSETDISDTTQDDDTSGETESIEIEGKENEDELQSVETENDNYDETRSTVQN